MIEFRIMPRITGGFLIAVHDDETHESVALSFDDKSSMVSFVNGMAERASAVEAWSSAKPEIFMKAFPEMF